MTSSTQALPAIAAPVAPTVTDAPSLAEAIATVTIGNGVTEASTAALWTLTRERYAFIAQSYATATPRGSVLADTFRGDILSALWREAGHSTAPAAADRDKGTRTFAQYVSRLAGVATNPDHGLDALSSDDDAAAALKAIKDAKADTAASVSLTRTAVSVQAFQAWMDALPSADRAAIKRTMTVFSGDSVARQHALTFAAALTASHGK